VCEGGREGGSGCVSGCIRRACKCECVCLMHYFSLVSSLLHCVTASLLHFRPKGSSDDSAHVRIWRERLPTCDPTPRHSHIRGGAYILLSGCVPEHHS
jgi:hypothetical protein